VRRPLRILGRVLATLVLLVGLALATVLLLVRASLPVLDGERTVAGLDQTVTLERDRLGVVDIHATTRRDAAFALGYAHAQDRFFAMDLTRRAAAGTLAELFGSVAVDYDRQLRIHRFGAVADRVLTEIPARETALLTAYSGGVNAGLDDLRARPFEYWLLRQEPRPWEPRDTVLVLLAMFLDLQDRRARIDTARGLLEELAPPALAAFLAPDGDAWEAPLVGGASPPPPLPGPDDLLAAPGLPGPGPEPPRPGSNAFAVAGSHTRDGGALLANDMHLGLRVPNLWYRARFTWVEAGRRHQAVGATLPGTPALVVGSNGFVAWGVTNAYGDWLDRVDLEVEGDRYRTPEGWRAFDETTEEIAVRGADPVTTTFRSTVWGPVVDGPGGRPQALLWVAQEPGGVNLEVLRWELARSVDEVLDLAPQCGLPAVNILVADRGGRVGWTVAGRVPRRIGFDGRTPVSMADGSARWDGWLPAAEVPRVVDPEDGRLWSANSRHPDGEDQRILGDSGYALGARAGQIRDALRALPAAREADLLAIQLDDRAHFLERWYRLAVAVLADDAAGRAALRDWEGRASTGSVAYHVVDAFRTHVHEAVVGHLTAGLVARAPDFPVARLPRREIPVWAAVSSRAPHLLPPGHADWEAFLRACARDAVAAAGATPWGQANALSIRHPLSGALPGLAGWLDLPRRPMPGDARMPRVQGPDFGATQRMVVSPGREEAGIFHMPGGQSGHPLSPYYRAGHRDWVEGRPSPFLPGPARRRLELRPG